MNEENKEVTGLEEGQEQEQKTYTKDEVMDLLQRESDRRVTQALAKQKKEFDKKLSLSQLDESQRAESEKDRRLAELEETVKNFTKVQNKNEVMKVLSARGLNAQFADIIEIGEDIEEAQQKIETLDKLFKNAVAEEVKKRLAGNTPKDANKTDAITQEDFNKMSMAQKSKLFNENPELFKRLSGK